MNVLQEHRISNARYGEVACYCSAWKWMTLDEYGEHVEALAAGLDTGSGMSGDEYAAFDSSDLGSAAVVGLVAGVLATLFIFAVVTALL